MPRTALRKEKWTLSFDPALKSMSRQGSQAPGSLPCDRARKSCEGKV